TFIALPAFQDNYIWLLADDTTFKVTAVDPGDARPVIRWLGRHPEYQLSTILLTHHHRDHTGGVLSLKAATQCRVLGPDNPAIDGIDRTLADGDQINLAGQSIRVIAVPGHTLDHIAFFCDDPQEPWLLSGDTLFAGGCGRVFEGTPEQMHDSLQRLPALPDAGDGVSEAPRSSCTTRASVWPPCRTASPDPAPMHIPRRTCALIRRWNLKTPTSADAWRWWKTCAGMVRSSCPPRSPWRSG